MLGAIANWPEMLKETFRAWSDDKGPRLGAALAYYSAFSLAPLLLIAMAVAGLFFGRDAAQGKIAEQIQGLIGRDAAQAVQSMVKNSRHAGTGFFASVIGLVMLVLGASGVFAELQDSLNTIWKVEPRPKLKFLHAIRQRFLDFGMVFAIGFLLLISLVISAALSVVGHFISPFPSGYLFLLHLLEAVVSAAVITALFAAIFKFLPDAPVAWKDVWVGAGLTAVLFTLGKFLIGLYLGHSSIASSYGAAGSLMVALVWVYYSAQILFFGAEFTKVHAERSGSSRSAAPGGPSK